MTEQPPEFEDRIHERYGHLIQRATVGPLDRLRYPPLPVKPEACTCTNHCPESDNPCPHCSRLDPYDPCPVVGFGCGASCDDIDHCSPEQREAADSEGPAAEVKRSIADRLLDALDENQNVLLRAVQQLMFEAWAEGFKQGGPMHDVNYDDPDAHRRNPYEPTATG